VDCLHGLLEGEMLVVGSGYSLEFGGLKIIEQRW